MSEACRCCRVVDGAAAVARRWAGTKANTQSVTLQHNDRAYLVASCYGDTFSPSLYDTKFQVLGKVQHRVD